jgi:hypothetical protein
MLQPFVPSTNYVPNNVRVQAQMPSFTFSKPFAPTPISAPVEISTQPAPPTTDVNVEVHTTQPTKYKVNLARLPPQTSLIINAHNNTEKPVSLYIFVEKLSQKAEASTEYLNSKIFWSQCHAKPRLKRYNKAAKSSRNEKAPNEIGMDIFMDKLVLQLASTKSCSKQGTVEASTCCSHIIAECYHSWISIELGPRSRLENMRILFNITQESQNLGKTLAPFFRISSFGITNNNTLSPIGKPFITGVINRGKNEERLVKYMDTLTKFWPHLLNITDVNVAREGLDDILNNDIDTTTDCYNAENVSNIVRAGKTHVVQRLNSKTKQIFIDNSIVEKSESMDVEMVYDSSFGDPDKLCEHILTNVPTSVLPEFKLWTDYGPHVGIINEEEDD